MISALYPREDVGVWDVCTHNGARSALARLWTADSEHTCVDVLHVGVCPEFPELTAVQETIPIKTQSVQAQWPEAPLRTVLSRQHRNCSDLFYDLHEQNTFSGWTVASSIRLTIPGARWELNNTHFGWLLLLRLHFPADTHPLLSSMYSILLTLSSLGMPPVGTDLFYFMFLFFFLF